VFSRVPKPISVPFGPENFSKFMVLTKAVLEPFLKFKVSGIGSGTLFLNLGLRPEPGSGTLQNLGF
jgi:hypothetical protein